MVNHQDSEFDATRPGLVLLYGNASKTYRALDRDVTIVGRAHGCDFGLNAPDISSVHCIITRTGQGFRVRDCQSRAGTKLNGNNVRESPLRDGDILQLGPFSFRVHLPGGTVIVPTQAGNARIHHLEQSRRHLARIALRQRKKLRLQGVINAGKSGKSGKGQLSKVLQQRQRDVDAQFRQLESREQQLQASLTTIQEQERQMAAERQELARRHQELTQQIEAFARQQQEFSTMRDQWTQDQHSIITRLGQQKAALARVEETLHDHRQELDDVLTALQEGTALSGGGGSAETEKLRQENEHLRRLLDEPVRADGAAEEQLKQLKTENDELKQLLDMMERHREQRDNAGTLGADAMSAELAELRRLMQEKDAMLEELTKPQPAKIQRDIDTYETELNEFQRQLETDRHKVNQEIEQLRARNKELDDATREMELEMSRERAEIARERQRIDRLRDDVRLELERMQRDSGLRDRLAPVQNLREQINHRKQPANDQTPKPQIEDPMQARLRALRNKLSDS